MIVKTEQENLLKMLQENTCKVYFLPEYIVYYDYFEGSKFHNQITNEITNQGNGEDHKFTREVKLENGAKEIKRNGTDLGCGR